MQNKILYGFLSFEIDKKAIKLQKKVKTHLKLVLIFGKLA
jgi:hypothetical protein